MATQFIILEYRNICPQVVQIVSNKEITIKRVGKYYEKYEDFDKEKDSLTFVDVSNLNIDIKEGK